MNNKMATWAAAIAGLACVGSLRAHHSISVIDVSTAIWVKGTVVRYEPINPHTMIELEGRTEDGQVQRWTIEGPILGRLNRILSVNGIQGDEDFLQVGDVIEVCGFFPKRSVATRGTSQNADGSSLPYVHGHVLVMPDGRMRSWGPYGKLDNCVRRNDEPEAWLEFLNADPLALELWCNSRAFFGVASTAPRGFVEKVNRLMSKKSCD
jgi:hypothetical protein